MTQNRGDILYEIRVNQGATVQRFEISKHIMLCSMGFVIIYIATQLAVVYGLSDFAATSPGEVSSIQFVKSQVNLSWFSWLN